MLRRLFEDSGDLVLLEVGATTLGHLVRSGGPMMADVVERQVGGGCVFWSVRLVLGFWQCVLCVCGCWEGLVCSCGCAGKLQLAAVAEPEVVESTLD